MELRSINIDGKSADSKYTADFLDAVEQNNELVNQQIRVIRTNQRQGNANTKTRAEVSGGGKKPWRQKGTGRARVGSIRSPLWRGGGVIHGPKSKTWSLNFTKRMKAKAFETVLSDYALNDNLVILNIDNDFNKPSTKTAGVIANVLDNKSSIIVITDNKNIYLSFRNIKNIIVKSPKDVNILDILTKNIILTTKEDMNILKERI